MNLQSLHDLTRLSQLLEKPESAIVSEHALDASARDSLMLRVLGWSVRGVNFSSQHGVQDMRDVEDTIMAEEVEFCVPHIDVAFH